MIRPASPPGVTTGRPANSQASMPPSTLRTSYPASASAWATAPGAPADPAHTDHGPIVRDAVDLVGHQAHGHVDGLGGVAGLPFVVLPDIEQERPVLHQAAGGVDVDVGGGGRRVGSPHHGTGARPPPGPTDHDGRSISSMRTPSGSVQ